MCVWNRHDRVTNMLRALALSQDVSVDVYLWNNRAAAAGELIEEIRRCTHALPRTMVASCETNIGGFGRFYWARELAARYPYVIFLDDDQILDPFSLRDLVAASEDARDDPRCLGDSTSPTATSTGGGGRRPRVPP